MDFHIRTNLVHTDYGHKNIPFLPSFLPVIPTILFEILGIQALHIAVQATKRRKIQNLPGYYSGILGELINKALFTNAFQDYDVPVEGLYWG